MTKTRDFSIDILRAIALMGIVCIHIKPSIVLAELRNFDVSLMVFLSGISFAISNSYKSNIYLKKGGVLAVRQKEDCPPDFPHMDIPHPVCIRTNSSQREIPFPVLHG